MNSRVCLETTKKLPFHFRQKTDAMRVPLRTMFRFTWLTVLAMAAVLSEGTGPLLANPPWQHLAESIVPLQSCLSGDRPTFALSIESSIEIDGKRQPVSVKLVRWNENDYDFHAAHPDYAASLCRRADQTVFSLPLHQVEFVGQGTPADQDHLSPSGLLTQLIDGDSQLDHWWPFLKSDPQLVALLVSQIPKLTYDSEQQQWNYRSDVSLKVHTTPADAMPANAAPAGLQRWQLSGKSWDVTVSLSVPEGAVPSPLHGEWKQIPLDRVELEQQISRGVRRALAVLAPSAMLMNPRQTPRQVEQGELRWQEGQRLVLLSGTPEQIGTAHAQLLRKESIRCMDSVLNLFGTVETVRSGRWFRQTLDEAFERLQPHIPESHLQEMAALGTELGWPVQTVQALNVFPELFHCSGFAVMGSATKEGVLYHGRVLDYMTMIGLQDSATTFIIAPSSKHAFANVGYGGFVGSVSGMNNQGISLGEMGGRGEGKWDGVPMATLMRRALEECQTLDDVVDLWKRSPRTCEYYYVFAEAKPGIRRAVGLAATPEQVEIVQPGQAHPLLGPGIQDAVVLSAGARLETLRARVQDKHGTINAEDALWLMSRPVAMKTNLHNVLFVPEQGVLYVANADHKSPAAERPYVKFQLMDLLNELAGSSPKGASVDR